MDDEIHFGEFQHAQPEPGIAPDRNPHHACAWVGSADDGLAIFIDVDVMLELESHALDNTDVELGGVLLGEQQTDDQGRPFVVVRDSLRAEHYQATRGSFKFTHDTWETITRQREQFPNPWAMVGWYHTHPGWGVFLSDMDMFICQHFFNRPLDVALVIDPVRDDRGWFFWDQGARPTKRQVKRFCLFGHRHRQDEIQASADRYNQGESMSNQPRTRYSSASPAAPANVTVVERTIGPAAGVALAALIVGQLLLTSAVLWRSSSPGVSSTAAQDATQVELLVRERQAQAKADTLRAMLVDVVEKTPEQSGIVERWTSLNEQNESLRLNLDGQAAMVREVNTKLNAAQKQLTDLSENYQSLNKTLADRNSLIKDLQGRVDSLSVTGTPPAGTAWYWFALIAILAAAAGAGGVLIALYFLRTSQTFAKQDDDWDSADRDGPGNDSKIKLA